jgi:cation transport ATPase
MNPSNKLENSITLMSLIGLGVFLLLRYGFNIDNEIYTLSLNALLNSANTPLYTQKIIIQLRLFDLPLCTVLILGGIPLVYQLLCKLLHKEFGADLLAGISIIAAVWLHEYLAGSLVVLMLSGGAVLESYAVRKASSVLEALAKRMPSTAHKKVGEELLDISTEQVTIGDTLLVLPHDICPVDGTVLAGSGTMDESFLTGEPYSMSKITG